MHLPAVTSTARARRLAGLVAAAAVAAAVAPGAASAAVVSTSSGVLTYQAAAGEVNEPIPFVENGHLKLREANPATPLSAGLGCQIVSNRLADCGGASSVRANLGDRDDIYFGTGAGSFGVFVNAGDGNDRLFDGNGVAHRETYVGGAGTDTATYSLATSPVSLTLDDRADDGQAGEGDFIASDVENLEGGSSSDVLTGNSAANVLRGNPGNDHLSGFGGNDVIEEGTASSGADLISGGSGVDRVRYLERNVGVSVTLDGNADDGQAGEADNVLPDVENITGTQFADRLIGSDLANAIGGLAGNDTINPLGGSDSVSGGNGDDSINVNDGVKDIARGNAGSDRIAHDSLDDVIA